MENKSEGWESGEQERDGGVENKSEGWESGEQERGKGEWRTRVRD